jgi:hypothetical protein
VQEESSLLKTTLGHSKVRASVRTPLGCAACHLPTLVRRSPGDGGSFLQPFHWHWVLVRAVCSPLPLLILEDSRPVVVSLLRTWAFRNLYVCRIQTHLLIALCGLEREAQDLEVV